MEFPICMSQVDSYNRSSVNKVLACTPLIDDKTGAEVYSVILDDCVLYPEGGGQPCDYGSINGHEVQIIRKVDGIEYSLNAIQAIVPMSMPVGADVVCEVDWDRRFDHMQQHTSQHLLSGIAFNLFQADTVGWMLGTDTVTVDLALPNGVMLDAEQVELLESRINSEIRKGSRVSWVMKAKDEIIGNSIIVENDEEIPIRGVPKGAAINLETLRFVVIQGLDANPCGGTHVNSLSEIQLLKIIAIERDRESCRLRFIAGNRAFKAFSDALRREASLCATLSAPPKLLPSAVEKVVGDRKDLEKKQNQLQEELSQKIGQLAAAKYLSTFQLEQQKLLQIHRRGSDLNFVIMIADAVANYLSSHLAPDVMPCIFVSGDESTPVVEKKSSKKKPTDQTNDVPEHAVPGAFVLVGKNDFIVRVKDDISSMLDARSGGRPGRLQGQAKNISMASLFQVKDIINRNS